MRAIPCALITGTAAKLPPPSCHYPAGMSGSGNYFNPDRLHSSAGRPSVAGAFLRELRLEFFHDRCRINAGLLGVLGPLFLEGLRGFFPFSDLGGRGLVDLLTGLCLDLGDPGVFEIGPG